MLCPFCSFDVSKVTDTFRSQRYKSVPSKDGIPDDKKVVEDNNTDTRVHLCTNCNLVINVVCTAQLIEVYDQRLRRKLYLSLTEFLAWKEDGTVPNYSKEK